MAEVVKLSVNLSREVVDALKRIAERDNVTVTEALRRSISTQKFIDDQQQDGAKILVEDKDKKTVRQVVFR